MIACRNSRCAAATTEAILVFFPVTSARAGIPLRQVVVEIVDVDSPEFHTIQQVRFSKLLNLQVRQEGAHLRPSRFPAFREMPYFQIARFIGDTRALLKAVELY